MKDNVNDISFNSHQGLITGFEILPLEELLNRTDLSHDPRHMHRVQFYVMIIVTSGGGKHTIDFKEHEYSTGSILTIRKNQIHSFHGVEAKGFMILFTEEYLVSFLDQTSSEKIARFFNELLFQQHTLIDHTLFTEITSVIDQIQVEFNQSKDDHTSAIIRNYLQILISKVYRCREKSSGKNTDNKYTSSFIKLQLLVEAHCKSERNVQFYADQLSVTSRTLNNITHATVHQSAKAFIDQVTILQIKRLLINTSLSVKEIAYQSGFNEPTNLFKFFKRSTGQTPEAFREALT